MQVCLELVLAIALRNRDRILLMWSLVHDYLALVMAPEGARTANPLVARAALGLLRVCQRLLPYKADCAPPLLRSLQLLLRLNASVAWDLATRLAAEVSWLRIDSADRHASRVIMMCREVASAMRLFMGAPYQLFKVAWVLAVVLSGRRGLQVVNTYTARI